MANKFLPFIVEKSPLHSIYQTMLSRSKGIHTHTFLSVFYIIGKHGIKKVREFVLSQSEQMDTNTLYQAISMHFDGEVDSNDLEAFHLLGRVMSFSDISEGDSKFNEYSVSDLLGFIYVLSLLERADEYFKTDYVGFLKNHSYVVKNIKEFVTLDDEEPDKFVTVESKEDLISRILHLSLIAPSDGDSYKFVKVVKQEEDEGVPF